jgi:hypothetical protein
METLLERKVKVWGSLVIGSCSGKEACNSEVPVDASIPGK